MISHYKLVIAKLFALLGLLILAPATALAQTECAAAPVVLQVLGSGGPYGVGRASTGYLIWIDGVGRIMVDAGGGTFTRFHEAGAKVADLDLLAMTHFHPDHASEVPALLWVQATDVTLSGPTGSDGYPSTTEYVDGLFGQDGVFRAVTDGRGLETVTVDVTQSEPTEVFANESIRVQALGVPHGIVPAIGYRIDIGDISIAFSSDQNGSDPAFAEFASGVDILVVHLAVPETATGFAADLHAKPSVWGQMATDANVGTLVLSHLLKVPPDTAEGDLPSFDEKLVHLRSRYEGPLVIAEDLMCIPLTASADAAPVEVQFDTSDEITIFGDLYASPEGKSAPIILLFHQGGGEARGEYTDIAGRLLENGYNVLAIDQRMGGGLFDGVNRTVAALEQTDYGFCDAYPDLEAALAFARESGYSGPLAVWGSSYSAALAFQLAAKHADEIAAILGFSPASGKPLAGCMPNRYLASLTTPALALRPQREFEIESVQAQMTEFERFGVQTYVADPGVHGSSMLNAERVGHSTEATWQIVLDFLATTLSAPP